MEPVHVLGRVDRLDDRARTDLRRQRQLHQDAIDRRIGVQQLHQRQQFRFSRARGQVVRARDDPGLFARAALVAHVDLGGGRVAHHHHGQARSPLARRRQGVGRAADFGLDFLGQSLAVDDFRAHEPNPPWKLRYCRTIRAYV
jgi:hypothetical protein